MYYNLEETKIRTEKVKQILKKTGVDAAFVYFDELNVANGWYLTGWCPQFEKGAVLVPLEGEPILLGGPESQPFALMESALKKSYSFPVFMVPEEEYPNATIINFGQLNEELENGGTVVKRLGMVGTTTIPHAVYTLLKEGFKDIEFVDITEEYEELRIVKSAWELECMKQSTLMCDNAYDAMRAKIAPGVYEYEVAAAGEYVCRNMGANSFAYGTMVGSGIRSNACVPTASNKIMKEGELVLFGIAPRVNGYAATFGDTLPVAGTFTQIQRDGMMWLRDVLQLTKSMLKPGVSGREIDEKGRKYFEKHGLMKYLICPFAHTIGLMEAEAPFFGPNSKDVLKPGMAVMVDVSFFGHPQLNGARIETGYIITENGHVPFSEKMDKYFMENL